MQGIELNAKPRPLLLYKHGCLKVAGVQP